MHSTLALTAIFLASMLAGPAATAADSQPVHECCNIVCPVDGNPVDATTPPVAIAMGEGDTTVSVGTCGKECAAKIVADPKTYRARIWASMKERADQGRIKGLSKSEMLQACCNTTCPVDGKPVDATVPPALFKPSRGPKSAESLVVGFCSETCMTNFKANPAAFEEALFLKEKNKPVKAGQD